MYKIEEDDIEEVQYACLKCSYDWTEYFRKNENRKPKCPHCGSKETQPINVTKEFKKG